MEKDYSLNTIERPVVKVVSKTSNFTLMLIEKLLINYCRVNLITENTEIWKSKTKHIKDNKYFQIIKTDTGDNDADFVIYVSSLLSENTDDILSNNLESEKDLIQEINKTAKDTKAVFIQPSSNIGDVAKSYYRLYEDEISNKNVLIVFTGNIVGNRTVFTQRDPMSILLYSNKFDDKNLFIRNYRYYPTSSSNLTDEIIKNLFSFTTGVSEVWLRGERRSRKSLTKTLRNISGKNAQNILMESDYIGSCGDIKTIKVKIDNYLDEVKKSYEDLEKEINKENIVYEDKETIDEKERGVDREIVREDAKDDKMYETEENPDPLIIEIKEIRGKGKSNVDENGKKENAKKLLKNILEFGKKAIKPSFYIFIFLLVVFLPYILTIGSLTPLLYAKSKIEKKQYNSSRKAFVVSYALANAALDTYSVYEKIPVVKNIYFEGQTLTKTLVDVNDIVLNLIDLNRVTTKLAENILTKKEYQLTDYQDTISINLDYVYRKVSFIESEYKLFHPLTKKLFSKYVNENQLNSLRKKLITAKELVFQLQEILGGSEEKKYLVLLQNNMELRPTGGFIGSFAILNFRKGVMDNYQVYDVYSADGQLKGYVKPPEPLEKHLDQAVWYLRDSNWDPDFNTSAKRAIWFLDKEMGIGVDGVIATDLEFARDILNVTGPILLTDYDKEITHDNLYEVTQYETEKEFFPGSRKKANFLESLSKAYLYKLFNYDENEYLSFAKIVYQNLEERHIQIFHENEDVENKISDLGWAGNVKIKNCNADNCYQDMVGLVEANLGVNKANYFINRYVYLKSYIQKDKIRRELDLTLKNNANPTLGNIGKYSVYIRLLSPNDAFFEKVRISSSDGSTEVEPEVLEVDNRLEAGVWVEVPAGTSKTISFKWESENNNLDFKQNGEYGLLIRKQSGVGPYRMGMEINLPENLVIGTSSEHGLTGKGLFRYNTEVVKDLDTQFYW